MRTLILAHIIMLVKIPGRSYFPDGANFDGANFDGDTFDGVNFDGANFDGAKFEADSRRS